jgi:polar amino acid transport system substrate-binding protein
LPGQRSVGGVQMRTRLFAVAALVALVGAACSSGGSSSSKSLLDQVKSNGKLRVATDPAYPPQSSYDEATQKWEGFDIDVANEIAKRLGVAAPAWETPDWEVLTAGSWNDRWDMSVGSMTPVNERQKVLNFTEPYSFVPAVAVVHEDSNVSDVTTDLDGKKIGVCSACTYDFFLQKSLEISGYEFNFVIDDATIVGYDTDTSALQDLALGDGTRLDAVMTSITTAEEFAKDNPVKIVGDELFGEPLAVAFDKSSELDGTSLKDAVDQIVADMHSDGTLSALSKKWYGGIDVTKVSS